MEDERKLRPQCSILYLPSSIFHPLSSVLTLGLAGDLALAAFRSKIPGPEWIFPVLLIGWPALVAGFSWAIHQRNGRVALRGVFGLLAVIYCGTYSYQTHFLNPYDDDTAFLRQVNDVVVPGQPFYVNRDTQPLDGFRTLFYLRDGAVLLQNLTFLLDERIEHEEVYLVTRYQDVERLSRYGAPEVLLQSKHTRAEHSIGDRWTLFRLRFRHDLIRKPGDIRISPMQVTGRQEGPFLH